jgi:hypothetical protein
VAPLDQWTERVAQSSFDGDPTPSRESIGGEAVQAATTSAQHATTIIGSEPPIK